MINNLEKLFSQILTSRVSSWAEENGILPEAQAGFRPGRSCIDNIFTLASVTQTYLMQNKKPLYAIFVDYKKAFDNVNHQLLWSKLHKLRCSSKILNILSKYYKQANFKIKIQQQCSESIPITKGVLQGDPLSPILFSLFTADIEIFFRKMGHKGITILDILLLLYADDMVILAKSPNEVRRLLLTLAKYCKENGLEVNASKTQILYFHKGRKPAEENFYYNGKKLKVVNKYTYLGIPFTASGLFLETTKHFINKGLAATGTIHNLLAKAKSEAWSTKSHLLKSVILPTSLYAAEVWSLRYIEKLETVQTRYIKRLLQLPRQTPNYLIRCETGEDNIQVRILKKTLSWWNKILLMNNERYPRKCYNLMLELDSSTTNVIKYNWFSQLKLWLNLFDENGAWTSNIHTPNSSIHSDILSLHTQYVRYIDNERIINSNYNERYKHLRPISYIPAIYLSLPKTVATRTTAKLRLSNYNSPSLYIDGVNHRLGEEDTCTLCNMKKKEDLNHFLTECPTYKLQREYYLSNLKNQSGYYDLHTLLSPSSSENTVKIHKFTVSALYTRHCIIAECS